MGTVLPFRQSKKDLTEQATGRWFTVLRARQDAIIKKIGDTDDLEVEEITTTVRLRRRDGRPWDMNGQPVRTIRVSETRPGPTIDTEEPDYYTAEALVRPRDRAPRWISLPAELAQGLIGK